MELIPFGNKLFICKQFWSLKKSKVWIQGIKVYYDLYEKQTNKQKNKQKPATACDPLMHSERVLMPMELANVRWSH